MGDEAGGGRGHGERHRGGGVELLLGARQRLPPLPLPDSPLLDRGLDRLVDELDAGTDRHVVEQVLDVIGAQTHATAAHPQTYAEGGVGAVDGIEVADIEGVQAHGVVRTGRPDRRQCLALGGVAATDVLGRGPGRVGALALHLGDPVLRGVDPQLADADGQHLHHVLAFRVVVETHLGHVDDDPLARCIRQDQLMRNGQLAARRRQIGVDARVRFHDVGQAQLEVGGDLLQRTVVCGHHAHRVLPAQAAVVGWQRVFNGGGLLADQGQSAKKGRSGNAKGIHKIPVWFPVPVGLKPVHPRSVPCHE